MNCNRSQLLELAAKWDKVGALQIVCESEVDETELVGLFCIPKDQDFDRLIIDPTTINSRCHGYSNYTRFLAPGALLTQLHLQPHESARFSADDLTEMYYTFRVPPARAIRNTIRTKFRSSEVAHFRAFNPAVHRGYVFLCLATLAMGDQMAVEIAQQAHWNVLSFRAGAMLQSEVAADRKPFPCTPTIELLVIDDHVTCQKVSRAPGATAGSPLRDELIFARAETAYLDVGLVQHEKKRKRGLQSTTLLGAEVDGEAGFVAAPRHRVGVLMMATAIIVRKACCTPALLSSVIGLWVHVVMFRRPTLALLGAAFTNARAEPKNEVRHLSRETLNELLSLVLLAPILQTDVRVGYVPEVFAMDAFFAGAGLVAAPVDTTVVQELWRHGEHRGYYTRLEGTATALLREQGFDTEEVFGAPQSYLPGGRMIVPVPLREGVLYDAAAFFGGAENWRSAHAALGLSILPAGALARPLSDLTDLAHDATWRELVGLVLRRVVREWHFAPPSLSFSSLTHPRFRSLRFPLGFSPRGPQTVQHTVAARRLGMLANLISREGGYVSICQPRASIMFHLHTFKVFILSGAVRSLLSYANFESPFLGATVWLHNKPWVHELAKGQSTRAHSDPLPVRGSISADLLAELGARCLPSVKAVFGREPGLGESVAALASVPPTFLCQRMAAGSLAERREGTTLMPLSAKLASAAWAWPGALSGVSTPVGGRFAERPFFDDPERISELADGLGFREMLRYKFARAGHINVQETRVYKTWLKYLCKHHFRIRAIGMIDSRVLLGAASKGRSSSGALGRVLKSSLPYVLGGALAAGWRHRASPAKGASRLAVRICFYHPAEDV